MDWVAIIIALFTPATVFGATYLVHKYRPKISGQMIVLVVVPVFSAMITIATQLVISTEVGSIVQMILGLVSVFASQVIIQTNNARQEKVVENGGIPVQ